MEANYKFTIGQRVKQLDIGTDEIRYGTVIDYTSHSVFILWDGAKETSQYFTNEFDNIKLER